MLLEEGHPDSIRKHIIQEAHQIIRWGRAPEEELQTLKDNIRAKVDR
jgi:hypothetical protein